MLTRFSGKHILITGAASGIGRATALRFASEGANISIIDRNIYKANVVAEVIRSGGNKCIVVEADVSISESIHNAIDRVVNTMGNINILFTDAGIGSDESAEEMSIEQWKEVIETNLNGTYYTIKFAIPSLIKKPGNTIVTMASSMAGWDTSFGNGAYMASKEGVTGLTKSLALYLARYGVRVNSVCPGIIETNLGGGSPEEKKQSYESFAQHIPLGRVGQPEDVAAAVAFLASSEAKHITGAMLLIDGGQTLQSWSNAPYEIGKYPIEFDMNEFLEQSN